MKKIKINKGESFKHKNKDKVAKKNINFYVSDNFDETKIKKPKKSKKDKKTKLYNN